MGGRKPGFYYDIGRKAREILYRDYVQQPPSHYSWGYLNGSCNLLCDGVLGYSKCYIGTDLEFDTQIGQLSKCDGGLNFEVPYLRAALSLLEKGGILSASCYSKPLRDIAFAAEVTHRLVDKLTIIQLGSQYDINDLLMVKGRVNTDGDIGAILQLQFFSALFLTFAGEINVKAVSSAKMGIACSLQYEIPHIAFGRIRLPISIG